MTITLYTNASDKRRISKTLTAIETIQNVVCLDPVNILAPNFILEYIASRLSANYLFCTEFNRYYFLAEPTIEAGQRIIFPASVDVLMSYKDEIRALNTTVVRNEFYTKSCYLYDPLMTYTGKRQTETIIINSNVFNVREADTATYNFVLGMAGENGT